MTTQTEEAKLPAATAIHARMPKKTKIIAAAGAALLLSGATGVTLMMGGEDEAASESSYQRAPQDGRGGDDGASFVDVPPMVVNLRTSDGQARFLKIHFLIMAADADMKTRIDQKMPLIIDSYQPFLRELRPDDLSGSAAVYRIKEELILRAGEIVGPGAVSDVLIQDLIQQ